MARYFIFGTLFLLIGLIVFFIKKFLASEKLNEALSLKYPEQPWRWKPDWEKGVVESGKIGQMQLKPFPPSPGQSFSFKARLNWRLDPNTELFVELACLSTYYNNSTQSTDHGEVWQSTSPQELKIYRHTNSVDVEGRFEIPLEPEALASSPLVGVNGASYSWLITVRSPKPGFDKIANFEIPVYHVDNSNLQITLED